MESILIIGTGPAGLAIAGRLTHANVAFQMVEKAPMIASSWHAHYDRLHLHTVKRHSHLPYLPFPDDYPTYVPRQLLINYYERYAAHFSIRPTFNCGVKEIMAHGRSWMVHFENGQHQIYDKVIIATGVNRVPHYPDWSKQGNFNGRIIHSRQYKNPKPFKGQKVLVVGMGNTGAEIALDLSEHHIDTTLYVRSPINIVPRDLFGRPTQETALLLRKFPNWFADNLGLLLRRLVVGNVAPYGLQLSKLPPNKQLRLTGKTPVIDLGTLAAIKAGQIKVISEIPDFTTDRMMNKDNGEKPFDAIILATGYRPKIKAILPHLGPPFRPDGTPDWVVGKKENLGLFLIGFNNYQPSGILGAVVEESKTILEALKKSTGNHPKT